MSLPSSPAFVGQASSPPRAVVAVPAYLSLPSSPSFVGQASSLPPLPLLPLPLLPLPLLPLPLLPLPLLPLLSLLSFLSSPPFPPLPRPVVWVAGEGPGVRPLLAPAILLPLRATSP